MPKLNRGARRLAAVCGALAALAAPAVAQAASELVYISTYRAPPAAGQPPVDREGNGIYAVRIDSVTGKLTALGLQARLDRASWLVTHPKLPVIYSVADSGGGLKTEAMVHAFAADRATGALRQLSRVGSGGGDATHMAIDSASMTLFTANHDTGEVSALPLLADGGVGPVASSQKDVGTGPHPRQNRPQPHAVIVDPTHRYLLNNDFGADRIFVRPFDGKTRTLSAALPTTQATPPGTGPRHFAFSPNGRFLYLNTEIASTLITYRWDAARASLTEIQTVPLYPADYPATSLKSSSELAVSASGRFVYVSLRGDSDTVVAYAADPATGKLQELQRISSGGRSPRSFALDPSGRWMLVGNELTNTVKVFSVDPKTGRLAATGEEVPLPAPVAFTFVGG
jgi:6-phosphogluconolactonase